MAIAARTRAARDPADNERDLERTARDAVAVQMGWQIEPSGADTFSIRTSGGVTSRAAFFDALGDDPLLRLAVTTSLQESRHAAFALEMPALSTETAHLEAGFAIIDSPSLANVAPDPSPFAAQLADCDRVATFANLGGDAILIAPSPRAAPGAAHLAAFVRAASIDIIDVFWSSVARAVTQRVAARPKPLWVSTSGLGVHWLHVRLDDRPKYYRHRPFTDPMI